MKNQLCTNLKNLTYIDAQLKAYADIKLRNTELGNYPAEDGSTEYFLNIPEYYDKWSAFFKVFNKSVLWFCANKFSGIDFLRYRISKFLICFYSYIIMM